MSLDGLARFEERAPFQHRLLVPLLAAAGKLLTPWPTPTIYLVVEACAWAALVACARQIVIGSRFPTQSLDHGAGGADRGVPGLGAGDLAGEIPRLCRRRADWRHQRDHSTRSATSSALPNLYYPWDVPSAAFVLAIIACVLRLAKRRRRAESRPISRSPPVACLNRETTVLLVPLSVWSVWRSWPRGRSIAFGAAQVMAWAILMAAIAWASQAPPNDKATLPGGGLRVGPWTNLRTLHLSALRA